MDRPEKRTKKASPLQQRIRDYQDAQGQLEQDREELARLENKIAEDEVSVASIRDVLLDEIVEEADSAYRGRDYGKVQQLMGTLFEFADNDFDAFESSTLAGSSTLSLAPVESDDAQLALALVTGSESSRLTEKMLELAVCKDAVRVVQVHFGGQLDYACQHRLGGGARGLQVGAQQGLMPVALD